MKNLFSLFCILSLLPVLGMGQGETREAASHGYAYVSPGAIVSGGGAASTIQFGGGGEFNLYKGLGIGLDLGYMNPIEAMSSGVGVFSANGLYSFSRNGGTKLVPFITGGYSLLFRGDVLNAVNFGGGLNYWFSDKAGLRFEFRDYVQPQHWDAHFIQGRIGINIR
jgi:hypothetical protein